MADPFIKTQHLGDVDRPDIGQPCADYLAIPADHKDFGEAANEAGFCGFLFRVVIPREGQPALVLFERLDLPGDSE